MKINDIIFENATEEQLEVLRKEYFDDKGVYNNATHKFNYIRKKLSSRDQTFSEVSAGEFFEYIKSKKSNTPTPTQTPTQPNNYPKNSLKNDPELQQAVKDYISIFNQVPPDNVLVYTRNNKTPSLYAGALMLDFFWKTSKKYEGLGKSASEIFKIAREDAIKKSPVEFSFLYFFTPSVFFKNMVIYKVELKKLNREAVAQRNADNYTGDWDDRLPIDQVEQIIKSRRKRRYF